MLAVTPELIGRTASRIDVSTFLAAVALCIFGMFAIYSAGGEDVSLLVKQGVRVMVGIAAMFFLASISPSTLKKYTPHIFVMALVMLVLVLFIGTIGQGSRRWIQFGIFRLQPAEVMKIALPMMIAWLLTQSQLMNRSTAFIVSFILIVPPVLLVFKQPDLGTALLIGVAGVVAIYLGGLGWRWVAAGTLVGIALMPIVWNFMGKYQKMRVLVLFDPYEYATGPGYQTIQSQIAIGSGGVHGKGFLNGSQSQLDFIPERHTDFIFSVISEEFGLIGNLLLIATFAFLVWRCTLIAYRSRNDYARIVAGCIGFLLFTHMFVNMGMVSGILPVVGVPLPLISYGGTSMVVFLGGIGMVMGAMQDER